VRLGTLVLEIHHRAQAVLADGTDFEHLDLGPVRRALARVRSAPPEELQSRFALVEQLIAELGGTR
jgi:hypothetical protein